MNDDRVAAQKFAGLGGGGTIAASNDRAQRMECLHIAADFYMGRDPKDLISMAEAFHRFVNGVPDPTPRPGDENVHAAVEALADEPPATPDNSREGEDFGTVETVGDLPKNYTDYSVPDGLKADIPVDIPPFIQPADADAVMEAVRPIIGEPGEVTDDMVAEAQQQDRREAQVCGELAANPFIPKQHYNDPAAGDY